MLRLMPSRLARHVAPLLLFAIATGCWLWPALRLMDLAVPGNGAGDNLTFVWNTWWTRTALGQAHSLFDCPVLFAPFGVDLTLNTHTALPSSIAAVLSRGGSVVAATNLVIALHLVLNFLAAYALAWHLTRSTAGSVLAGLVFGWSPYVGAHLAGHFNLIAAWILPLSSLLLLRTLDRSDRISAMLLGLTLGAIVYVDYYYAIYVAVLVPLILFTRCSSLVRSRRQWKRWQRVTLALLSLLLLLDVTLVCVIVATGGTVIRIGGHTISMLSADNPTTLAGLLLTIGAGIAVLPMLSVRFDARQLWADARRLAVALVIAVVVATPVLIAAARLWQRGDYVTQRYLWRSAPAGIDAATFLLGNPSGLFWGTIASRSYARFGIDRMEQVGWIGPGVLALCAAALLLRGRDVRVRQWSAVALVFLVWALGPYLVAFGRSLHVMLPATIVRFIPVVANARIPARAVVMVYLASAVLAAMGLAALREQGRRTLAVLLTCIVVFDYVPAFPPIFLTDHPQLYDVLAQQSGQGAVCELPIGLRDGFGTTGRFDPRVLFYQTIHRRPITGGSVARLPPRIVDAYLRHPVLGTLLRLSEGQPLAAERPPAPSDAADALLAINLRYLVVNRGDCPADLLAYVETLPLRLLAEGDGRSLYEIVRRPISEAPPSPSHFPSIP
jgi:hypothetical protein